MKHSREEKMEAFGRLLDIMDDLRANCPWDKKQTFQSLRKLTIEETYELADAILEQDLSEIEEELGDLMLHMVFYAKLGEEQGAFDIKTALDRICAKLIRRHPHIYSDLKLDSAEAVKANWEKLKLKEGKDSVLDGLPTSLPAMVKAIRMQEKTALVGFEWEHKDQVWEKVLEELRELDEVRGASDSSIRVEEELGDLFFALINYARFENVDPELALERVNKRFKNRFQYIERHAGKDLNDMKLAEMDALWEEAKEKLES